VIGIVVLGAATFVAVRKAPRYGPAIEPAASSGGDDTIRRLIDDGQYVQAEALARKRLHDVERTPGAGSTQVADALRPLVEAIWRGELVGRKDGLALAQRAVELDERTRGADDPLTLVSVSNEAEVLDITRIYARSRPLHERVLRGREVLFGAAHPEVAEALCRLGTNREYDRDPETAKPLFERALAIWEASLGPDHPNVARALDGLVSTSVRTAGDADLKGFAERSLAIRERALGPEHPDVAESWINLGHVFYWRLGDSLSARRCYERALAILVARFGPESLPVADTRTRIAAALNSAESYAQARTLLEQALAIHEPALGGMSYTVGVDVYLLASAAESIGDNARALALFERARRNFETSGSEAFAAICMRRIASLAASAGDTGRAERLFEQALESEERTFGPEHTEVSATLLDYARLLQAIGEPARALELLERARAIQEKVLGKGHPWLAMTLVAIGHLQAGQGNLAQARTSIQEGLSIFERAFGRDASSVMDQVVDLASVEWLSGKTLEAQKLALGAEVMIRTTFRRVARSLSEREALYGAQLLDSSIDLALSTLAALGPDRGSAHQVWDELIRSRVLVLDEMTARHRAALESGSIAEAKALGASRDRLARLIVSGPDMARAEAYRDALAAAGTEVERAERALAERSAAFRHERERDGAGLDDVLAALPKGTALVSYVRYNAAHSGPDPSHTWPPASIPSYLALVAVSGARSFAVVPLGSAADVDADIRGWAEQASTAPVAVDAEQRYVVAGTRLRRAIWDPVKPFLRNAREVFVVPDGELHLVNFDTLPDATGRYLVDDGPLLHYVAAEKDLLDPRPALVARDGPVLLVGGAEYDAQRGSSPAKTGGPVYRGPGPPGEAFRARKFEPLDGTQTEVVELARMFEGSKTQTHRPEVVVLTGARADETAFKMLAPGKSLIHVATHGFFLELPSGGGGDSNPLLLSGLAFAAANHRNDTPLTDSDDGVLTAEEVASLDLRAADWVVLSACDSGVGAVRRGEGVLGLSRAFRVAGAAHLITSLWPVADNAVGDWMRSLYSARLTGVHAGAAVRQANRRVLEERRRQGRPTHPFYWGAFIETGSAD
jgi:CHAT domain-containing protein